MRRLLYSAIVVLAGSSAANALDPAIEEFYAKYSVPVPAVNEVVLCHGFGCKFRTSVTLTNDDFKRLRAILTKGKSSPRAEVDAIAEAVAWFERRIGPVTGTSRRTARAGPGQSGLRSEADCIDETINTTSLLIVLSELKLLRHHRVDAPEARGYLLDGRYPHATAVIASNAGSARWAIDPWTRRNGERPDTLPIEQWLEGKS